VPQFLLTVDPSTPLPRDPSFPEPDLAISQNPRTHEGFLLLYRELFEHTEFLEDTVVRMVHGRRVDRERLEAHLAQMAASIASSHRRLRLLRRRRGTRGDDGFHNDMVRATRVVREQAHILLKTSFLAERTHPGMDYIKTLSDLTNNVQGAFQHVVRSNVLMPIMMN
jgi:hypothetical protein